MTLLIAFRTRDTGASPCNRSAPSPLFLAGPGPLQRWAAHLDSLPPSLQHQFWRRVLQATRVTSQAILTAPLPGHANRGKGAAGSPRSRPQPLHPAAAASFAMGLGPGGLRRLLMEGDGDKMSDLHAVTQIDGVPLNAARAILAEAARRVVLHAIVCGLCPEAVGLSWREGGGLWPTALGAAGDWEEGEGAAMGEEAGGKTEGAWDGGDTVVVGGENARGDGGVSAENQRDDNGGEVVESPGDAKRLTSEAAVGETVREMGHAYSLGTTSPFVSGRENEDGGQSALPAGAAAALVRDNEGGLIGPGSGVHEQLGMGIGRDKGPGAVYALTGVLPAGHGQRRSFGTLGRAGRWGREHAEMRIFGICVGQDGWRGGTEGCNGVRRDRSVFLCGAARRMSGGGFGVAGLAEGRGRGEWGEASGWNEESSSEEEGESSSSEEEEESPSSDEEEEAGDVERWGTDDEEEGENDAVGWAEEKERLGREAEENDEEVDTGETHGWYDPRGHEAGNEADRDVGSTDLGGGADNDASEMDEHSQQSGGAGERSSSPHSGQNGGAVRWPGRRDGPVEASECMRLGLVGEEVAGSWVPAKGDVESVRTLDALRSLGLMAAEVRERGGLGQLE